MWKAIVLFVAFYCTSIAFAEENKDLADRKKDIEKNIDRAQAVCDKICERRGDAICSKFKTCDCKKVCLRVRKFVIRQKCSPMALKMGSFASRKLCFKQEFSNVFSKKAFGVLKTLFKNVYSNEANESGEVDESAESKEDEEVESDEEDEVESDDEDEV